MSSVRILFAGDSHGNLTYLDHALTVARQVGADRVVQVGDFGIWSGYHGHRFLQGLHAVTTAAGVRLDFVDGNHDNHDSLAELAGVDECRADDGSVLVTALVHWWPRGQVATIGGARFGFLGGAVSVDRHRRREGIDWWAGEDVTDADTDRLIAAAGQERLDVLVCHDTPDGITLPGWDGWPADALRDAAATRRRLRRAVEATRPALIVHGHWHTRHRTVLTTAGADVTVVGLAHEGLDGLAVLDTATGHVDDLGIPFPDSTSFAAVA